MEYMRMAMEVTLKTRVQYVRLDIDSPLDKGLCRVVGLSGLFQIPLISRKQAHCFDAEVNLTKDSLGVWSPIKAEAHFGGDYYITWEKRGEVVRNIPIAWKHPPQKWVKIPSICHTLKIHTCPG